MSALSRPLLYLLAALSTISGTAVSSLSEEIRELTSLPVGVTRQGATIAGFVPAHDRGVLDRRLRLVIVAGIDGSVHCSRQVERWMDAFNSTPAANEWSLAFVPRLNTDNHSADLEHAFPPPRGSYQSATVPEAQYLWRWIALFGPDLVIEVREGPTHRWVVSGDDSELESRELCGALSQSGIETFGKAAAIRLELPANRTISLEQLLQFAGSHVSRGTSEVRQVLRARAGRDALTVARQLSKIYGHTFDPVEYLQGTAVVGRLRLAELENDSAARADVERLAARWLGKATVNDKSSGGNFAGHWIFAEMAHRTNDSGYTRLVRNVADRGFNREGEMLPVMPTHSEMSDAVFMSTPMLVEAGCLTGDTRYFEMARRHVEYLLRLNLRNDGLHRHSPLDEAAWGRGNGFPALGLALCLDRIPADRPEREYFLKAFREHLAALRSHQDVTGMWHQVIDRPESYRELTATCMITYAMLRGIQQGWLDASDARAVERAWDALKLRIGGDGVLVDVCTGTGKQKSLRDYYDRQAILGKDARGGAMSLLVATEYARWKAGQP